jgi:glucosyl-3-phosphoglycerate synthase
MKAHKSFSVGRVGERMRSAYAWLQRALGLIGHEHPSGYKQGSITNAPPINCVSVVIPALNEASAIAGVIATALQDPATREVIVVDDSSTDETVAIAEKSGARVITSSMLGKGASMSDGVLAASSEFLVYLDGDLRGLRSHIISELVRPLVEDTADFVKAKFGRSGGRVTELTAKPMLNVFFPELMSIAQPLGGLIAARRSLLRTFEFEVGYGVDIGLLVDAYLSGARIAQVDIGSIEHDPQPLRDLSFMANEVSRVIFARAKSAGRLHVEQIAAMYEAQRHATAGIEFGLSRRKGRSRLLLMDVDCVIQSPLTKTFAQSAGNEQTRSDISVTTDDDIAARVHADAAALKFIHKKNLEKIALEIPLRPGAIEFVNQARRRGFMVVLFTNSFFVGADIVRRRVFADFAAAHLLQFDSEVCSGRVSINSAFLTRHASSSAPAVSLSNLLEHFVRNEQGGEIELIWTVNTDRKVVKSPGRPIQSFLIGEENTRERTSTSALSVQSFEMLIQILNRTIPAETITYAPPSAPLQTA